MGIPVGEAGSPITSDGLYLMAGMEVTTKGDLVALEMDVEMGGHLGIKVSLGKPNAEVNHPESNGYYTTHLCGMA